MLDWLAAIPNLGVPGVLGVPVSVSGGFGGTPAKILGVPGVPKHQFQALGTPTGTPGTPTGTPRRSFKSLNTNGEHPEHPEHRKNSIQEDATAWTRRLSRLDPCQAPDGFGMGRWQTLYDDALWLVENYGEQATRDGWSTADLFGLWPDKPRWGGIADRLGGARSLVMDGDRASWRIDGKIDRYARGAYPHLKPFWETDQ